MVLINMAVCIQSTHCPCKREQICFFSYSLCSPSFLYILMLLSPSPSDTLSSFAFTHSLFSYPFFHIYSSFATPLVSPPPSISHFFSVIPSFLSLSSSIYSVFSLLPLPKPSPLGKGPMVAARNHLPILAVCCLLLCLCVCVCVSN